MQESQHPTESFLSGDKAADVESDEEVMKYMLEYARQAITDQTRNSRIFDFEKDAAVPTFDFSGNGPVYIFIYIYIYIYI